MDSILHQPCARHKSWIQVAAVSGSKMSFKQIGVWKMARHPSDLTIARGAIQDHSDIEGLHQVHNQWVLRAVGPNPQKKSMTCSFLHDKMTRQKGHKWQICRMTFIEMLCLFWNIQSVCIYVTYIHTSKCIHIFIYIYTYIIHITLLHSVDREHGPNTELQNDRR